MNTTTFKEISRFENELSQCMKCGFCTFWCPVYQEDKLEASVARGKNELVKALVAGKLDFSRELANRLYKCTSCMACTENCPAKAQISKVIVAARADMVRAMGVRFPYSIVLRSLLPHRTLFGNILRCASLFQSVFMPKTDGVMRHLPFFITGLGKGRKIPTIAPRFLRQIVPEISQPPAGVKTVMRVGYFNGCMTEYVFPQQGQKLIQFLNRNGVEVVTSRRQVCCGAPVFLGAGDFDTARKIADANVAAFADVDCIVADCATCACALKEYPCFLADTPERVEAYSRFAGKVNHVAQFLTDVLKLPGSEYHTPEAIKGKKLTWHDPCHLNRHLGVKNQPRQILKSLPGTEYVEMPNADRCCGMAGQFNLFYYDLSKKIADRKVESIVVTGADIVATACPGCQLQLMDSLNRNGKPHKVMNLVELLE